MAHSIFTTDKDGRHITIMDTAWDSTKADFALLFDDPNFADYYSRGWVYKTIRKKLRESLNQAFIDPEFDSSGWYHVSDYVICGCYKEGKYRYYSFEYEISFHVVVIWGAEPQYNIVFGGPCYVNVTPVNVEMGD